MMNLFDIETFARVMPFFLILLAMISWEYLAPRRMEQKRTLRWPGNLGIFVFNVVVLMLMPITAVSAALVSIEYRFGLFFLFEVDFWPKVAITILLLDLLIYWQHRLFHKFEILWRIHRMHHTDIDFDVSTALRFHPLEMALSMMIKAAAIILIGAPVFAVVVFEVILNGCAMFNHSNIKIPYWLDDFMRKIIVTPDMHRVHHSTDENEHNQNYGFALSVWDRVFGSYTAQPGQPHDKMTIGLEIFNSPSEARFVRLVTQPFRIPEEKVTQDKL